MTRVAIIYVSHDQFVFYIHLYFSIGLVKELWHSRVCYMITIIIAKRALIDVLVIFQRKLAKSQKNLLPRSMLNSYKCRLEWSPQMAIYSYTLPDVVLKPLIALRSSFLTYAKI